MLLSRLVSYLISILHHFNKPQNLNNMSQLVYRSSGRKVTKSLSVEDRIIAKYKALGLSIKESRKYNKWLDIRIESMFLTNQNFA